MQPYVAQAAQLGLATKLRRSKTALRVPTLSLIGHYRSTLAVIAIVFGVLMYVAPRLSRWVPRLLDPATGRFNVAGIAVLSLLCGGLSRAVDRAVARYC